MLLKLSHGRYYLHFFQDNAFSMRGTAERVSLPSGSQMCFFIVLIVPSLLASVVHVLTRRTKTSWFTYNAKEMLQWGYILHYIIFEKRKFFIWKILKILKIYVQYEIKLLCQYYDTILAYLTIITTRSRYFKQATRIKRKDTTCAFITVCSIKNVKQNISAEILSKDFGFS